MKKILILLPLAIATAASASNCDLVLANPSKSNVTIKPLNKTKLTYTDESGKDKTITASDKAVTLKSSRGVTLSSGSNNCNWDFQVKKYRTHKYSISTFGCKTNNCKHSAQLDKKNPASSLPTSKESDLSIGTLD